MPVQARVALKEETITVSKKTALNSLHRKYGGRMVDFAGWELPVQYSSALKEHQAVRESAGVFDVSHMGQVEIKGPDALTFVQNVTCNDAGRLSDFQAQYSAFLNPEGTIIDDIVVYRFNAEHFFLCINSATTEKDVAWLEWRAFGNIQLGNMSDQYVQLAIQGPKAESILQKIVKTDLSAIKFYWFTTGVISGTEAIISRTGYTGEDGFEIYITPDKGEFLWEELFKAGEPYGISPAGLAARNTLRMEMKYPLYGSDITDKTTPLEAGLGWIVKFGTGFIGEDKLKEIKSEGIKRKLIGFEMIDAGIAREGYPVISGGEKSAVVTSGGYSPSLDKSIGMAYVPVEYSDIGSSLSVEIRGRRREAKIVATPFYKKK